MTTSELVRALAGRLGISQRQARKLLDGYMTAITEQLTDNNSVVIRNFGSFQIKELAEKRAYVPAKKALCLIPAHQKLQFRAAKKLREEVNQVETDE